MASYNKDKFILSVVIVLKQTNKKNNENISVWLRKNFTKSYWQMMKCLRQCCDTGICQNYNHIDTPTEKQKDCNADVTWSGSSWKTSSVYGHQYHVTLAKFFLVVLKNYTCTSFF